MNLKREHLPNHTEEPLVNRKRLLCTVALLGSVALASGCLGPQQVLTHGYQVNEQTLALIPEGSSREQVILALGTPSTSQKPPEGGETLYYISQKKARSVAFMQPKVVDQRVLAIYLDPAGNVSRRANYGLKDGKVFDFVRRVTPTGGKDLNFLSQLLSAAGTGSASGVKAPQ